jgi:membrane protease YdiL (CAAX protease family)
MKALDGGIFTIAAAFILGTFLTLIVLWLLQLADVQLGITRVLLITLFLTQGVACWGVALFPLANPSLREGAARIGLQRPSSGDLRAAAGACLWALAGAALGALVASALGLDPAEHEVIRLGRDTPELLLVLMPVSILLVGPGEELLFRGIVQTRLRDAFSSRQAVVIGSVLFAGVHMFAIVGSWPARLFAVLVLMLKSLAFGNIYERRRNLWVPALAHGLYDLVLLGFAYATVRAGH